MKRKYLADFKEPKRQLLPTTEIPLQHCITPKLKVPFLFVDHGAGGSNPASFHACKCHWAKHYTLNSFQQSLSVATHQMNLAKAALNLPKVIYHQRLPSFTLAWHQSVNIRMRV